MNTDNPGKVELLFIERAKPVPVEERALIFFRAQTRQEVISTNSMAASNDLLEWLVDQHAPIKLLLSSLSQNFEEIRDFRVDI